MLLFLDESYEKTGDGKYRMAYGGFAVDERKYRGLVAAVYQAKRRYVCVSPTGLSDTERIELAKTMIVQDVPLDRAELKSGKLMGLRQLRRMAEDGFSPGLALASSMLDALTESQATVFAVLSTPYKPGDILNPVGQIPVEYVRLFERVEQWMREEHSDGMVSVIPDNLDQCNSRLSKCLADYFFRSPKGNSMRHLVVTPFWVDSSVTVGSQLADIIAYILMDAMRPRNEPSPLYKLWNRVGALEFRSLDGAMRGIRTCRLNKKPTGGGLRPLVP